MKRALVLGAGPAGLSAALSLSAKGVPVLLLDRQGWGGRPEQLACKGIVECVRCDVCLAHDLVAKAMRDPLIQRMKGATLMALSGDAGGFTASIRRPDGQRTRRRVGSVIVCIGSDVFDADQEPRLGHGNVEGVLTAQELERALHDTGQTGKNGQLRSMAFIQCVGSRDAQHGAEYCSRACCKYSMKLGQLARKMLPAVKISYYIMDWRPCGPADDLYSWARTDGNVEVVRSRPAEVFEGEEGRPALRYASPGDGAIEERAFDLVVLSQGVRPTHDSADLCGRLALRKDDHGFIWSPPGEPCLTSREGVFSAGSCRRPMDIVEAAMDGATAASGAFESMGGNA